jgi:hypothetical protein
MRIRQIIIPVNFPMVDSSQLIAFYFSVDNSSFKRYSDSGQGIGVLLPLRQQIWRRGFFENLNLQTRPQIIGPMQNQGQNSTIIIP